MGATDLPRRVELILDATSRKGRNQQHESYWTRSSQGQLRKVVGARDDRTIVVHAVPEPDENGFLSLPAMLSAIRYYPSDMLDGILVVSEVGVEAAKPQMAVLGCALKSGVPIAYQDHRVGISLPAEYWR